jgi:cytochrome c-type biogenesis protein CcmF
VLNNLLLCSIAAVVLVGTLYPLFLDLLGGGMISVGAPFFNMASAAGGAAGGGDGGGAAAGLEARALWPVLQRLWWAASLALLGFLLALYCLGLERRCCRRWASRPASG